MLLREKLCVKLPPKESRAGPAVSLIAPCETALADSQLHLAGDLGSLRQAGMPRYDFDGMDIEVMN
jgi:hypothetical protein